MGSLSLVTIIVIALNILFSYKGFRDFNFFNKYNFNIGAVKKGEKIRYLSAGFLHVNSTHLFVNMLTLYFFADFLIKGDYRVRGLGTTGFIIIYLGSLILGNLFSYYFHKDEPEYTAVGASGAVMGVLYSTILLEPDMMLGLFFVIPIPAYLFGIGFLLYSIYGMKKQVGNIGHDAHFGGAMAGYFITLIMVPHLWQTHTTMTLLLALPLVILFIVYRKNLI